jgi:capsular exopolysaccharide synthesis family protein
VAETSYQSDSSNPAPNALQSVLRRWPLLLIGAIAGAVAGFLGFATQPPTYQSTAQLQVIKRDFARPSDMRAGYVDDYVANQLELLKSESILTAAAKSPKMQDASSEFREKLGDDELTAFRTLKSGLTVARSKETGIGPIGNSIVNLAFTCGDPRDAQIVLDAIIETYKQELASVSDRSMSDKIKQLETTLKSLQDSVDDNRALAVTKMGQRQKITNESPDELLRRMSTDKAQIFELDQKLSDINATLKQIKEAGDSPTKRQLTVAIITNNKRGIDPNASALETQLFNLELRKKLFGETLGPNHPQMKEIEEQIRFIRKEQERVNPDKTATDDLAMIEVQFRQQKEGLEERIKKYEDRKKADEKLLEDIRPLITEMAILDDTVKRREMKISEVQTELTSAKATQTASQTEMYEARVNNKPRAGLKVGPIALLWLVPGTLLGAMVGGGLAVLVELRDKSFRTPAEIRSRLGVPVFGHLPNIRTNMAREGDVSPEYDASLVSAIRPKSVEAEAYRGVRTQVTQKFNDVDHQVVQVTSPTPGDGKSTLAANLAISLAQSGKRTVLIDCDFRKPRVHKLFAIPKPEVGLASVTNGDTDLADAVRHSDITHLDVLPCGPRPHNPAELLSSPKFQEVLGELKRQYDYVIVDTPPLLAVSDPRVVAQRVDGVVMVFRITNKVRPLAERAREYLSDMGVNLLGVVVNGGGTKAGEYGYGYSYNYQYDYDYDYAEQSAVEEKSKF